MDTHGERPDAEQITTAYDRIGDISARWLGDNIHLGYWDDETRGTAEATDRLSDMTIERLGVQPGQRVLDVGCGNGRPAARLADGQGVHVVGMTNSRHHHDLARARVSRAGVSVTIDLADIMHPPYPPESFDAALALESISLMPEPATAVANIARVLRPGGRLVVAHMALSEPVVSREDQEFLEDFYAILTRPPFSTVDEHRVLIEQAGLRVEEITDIGDHVIGRSFAEMVPGFRSEIEREYSRLGETAVQASVMVDALGRFGRMPQAGYVILVASRPGGPTA